MFSHGQSSAPARTRTLDPVIKRQLDFYVSHPCFVNDFIGKDRSLSLKNHLLKYCIHLRELQGFSVSTENVFGSLPFSICCAATTAYFRQVGAIQMCGQHRQKRCLQIILIY